MSSRVTSGNRLLCLTLKQDKEDSSSEEEKGQGLSDDDSEYSDVDDNNHGNI